MSRVGTNGLANALLKGALQRLRPQHHATRSNSFGSRLSLARLFEGTSLAFIVLAVLTGVIAGFGAVGFRLLIGLFHNLFFFGHFSFIYHARVHTAASPFGALIILAPVVGAALVAFMVKNFAPEAKGHGVPEVMDAIYYNGGIIRPVVAVVKSLASAIGIGSGGSIGREGPIIQIGSAFGSTVGQILPVPLWQRMALIGCGAGGGIAATFNTPIGGVLFAIELIVPEISARTLVPLVLATGSATFISRLFLGDHPAFDISALALNSHALTSAPTLGAYAIFGIFLGLLSVVFIKSIYAFEDLFNRIKVSYYIRHMAAMAMLGVTMYLLLRFTGHYYVQGVGYAMVQDILTKNLTALPWFLLLLVLLKLIVTSLTLGSGGSGGVFSPSLFMGAAFGGAFAWIANHIVPGLGLDPVSTGVIGMAGVVGGATGAAVTAIVMIFEMTRDYAVIIPLLISVSIAYGVRRTIMVGSIYDMKLRRRGHIIPNVLQTNLYLLAHARDRIRDPVLRVSPNPNPERLGRLLRRVRRLPHIVIVDRGRVKAVIPASIVRGFEGSQALASAIEHHKRQPYVVVAADDMLFDVIAHLRNSACEVALVTETGEMQSADEIRGVLTLSDVLHGTQLPQLLLSRRRKAKTAYREGSEKPKKA